MEFQPKMRAPMCLIKNVNEELSVNQEALQILDQISNPVAVVAIVGPCRTGKSYLMNRLAGQKSGFPLGSTVESQTKGIWMWCMPHPTKKNCTLVLLDTEGLGNVEKRDSKNDSWIFALAVLLSSTFVYNSVGTINHQALEQLHYVTELTNLIKTKSSHCDGIQSSTEFAGFFPSFIWIVRDFILELKVQGQPVTADEYLENALKLIPEDSHRAQTSNLPRECIRNFFPQRKCFVFHQPTYHRHLLLNIENISEDELDSDFQEQTDSFCSYICSTTNIKTLRDGIEITGRGLGAMVETYVKAINSGVVPCLENAVTTLAQRENVAAVHKAATHYSEQMAQQLRLPTNTLQELLDMHAACEKEAIAVFAESSFKDKDGKFKEQLLKIIQHEKEDFLLKNEKESEQYCQEELDRLSKPLKEKISAGAFSVPGGHKLYMEMRESIMKEYKQLPRKGVKAEEVLHRVLEEQEQMQMVAQERALRETMEQVRMQLEFEREYDRRLQEQMERENHRGEQAYIQALGVALGLTLSMLLRRY